MVGSLYRPPNSETTHFINMLSELMSKLKLEQKKEVILGMDHNIDLLKCGHHKQTQQFLELMLENNL